MPASLAEARRLLALLGFDKTRSNERSGRVLLALLDQKPDQPWAKSTGDANTVHGLRAIISNYWDFNYAVGSRESIRKFTLHQFVQAGLVEVNHDDPIRAVNSDQNNYRVSPRALALIRTFDTADFEAELSGYLADLPGLITEYQAAREMNKIPVTLPDGELVALSPGGQNVLLAAMVEDFCPRFTPGGQVLYLGDADEKFATFEKDALARLGVVVDEHGKMPDLVVYVPDRNWLVLMEAVTSHGPVDPVRQTGLAHLFADARPSLVYVSCFPDRAVMRRYLTDLAWETEAWCADNPDHMIHFNGTKFLGPYAH